jgi:hypothetical protein
MLSDATFRIFLAEEQQVVAEALGQADGENGISDHVTVGARKTERHRERAGRARVF